MTVKVFVGRTTKGQPISPEYSHEMRTTLDIIQKLWSTFHHMSSFYAVLINLQSPSLDLAIITERGIGVVELKHYYGKISCRHDGSWYAGPKKMQAGVMGKGFKNPHEQVQRYAELFREKLLNPPLWQEPWLPGKAIDWPEFKFHTAVCFTHPDADLDGFDEQIRRRCRPITLPWENFSVLTLDDIPQWTAALRFEAGSRKASGYVRHRLTPTQIMRVVTELYGLSPWEEVEDLLSSGQPFAYLTLLEEGRGTQVYAIDSDETVIGRDWRNSDVLIPIRFSLVSRLHARIIRTVNGVFIEDLDSTNGTYVNGERIDSQFPLSEGQMITLGRPRPDIGVCVLEISFEGDDLDGLDKTESLRF